MKKFKKLYLFIGLCLAAIAVICPIYFYTTNVVIEGVEATVGADALAKTLAPNGDTYDESKVKVEGNTVTLLQDITFDTGTKAFAREATLNLNGHTLNMGAGCLSITVSGENKGNLTIEGKGTITNSGTKQVIQVISGGTLTIKDDVVVKGAKNVLVLQQGNFNMEGGTISALGTTAISDNKDSVITIKGGTITGNKAINCTNTSTVVIHNVNITGGSGIYANKNTSITIHNCNIETTGYSIALFDSASLVFEKGSIKSTEMCAITTNGAETDNANIIIKDGIITGSDKYAAMYLPGGGTTTITGGTISGGSGIILRSGSLNISNAKVESTAEFEATTVIGNSEVIPHDAIVVDNLSTGYGDNASVNIESGEFISNNAVFSTLGDEDITVEGGVFSNNVLKYVKDATTIKFTSDDIETWYVGEDVDKIAENVKAGDIIEVLQGDYSNDNIPDGTEVKNSGEGLVIVNGQVVEPNEGIIVHIHNLVNYEATDATCMENGNVEYWYCEECDSYFKDDQANDKFESKDETVIFATGHTLNHVDKKDATCLDNGNIEYWICESCDKVFEDEECTKEIDILDTIISSLNHSLDHVGAIEVTCESNGNYEYWYCKNCDSYFKDINASEKFESKNATIIPATDHDLKHVPQKDATCTQHGNREYWICKNCNSIFSSREATEELDYIDVVIFAAGHSLNRVLAKEATCTEAGNYEYWYCNKCEHYFKDALGLKEFESERDVVIPAAGHTLRAVNEKKATCTETGIRQHYTCTVCNKLFRDTNGTVEITSNDTIAPIVGHSLNKIPAKEATESAQGNIEYYICGFCKKMFADSEAKKEISGKDIVTPVKTHSLKHTDAKEATCAEAGNVEYWYCANCNTYYMDKDAKKSFLNKDATVIKAKSHNLVLHDAVDATTEKEGNIKYYSCSVCGKYFTDAEGKNEIAAKDVVIAKKVVESVNTENTTTEETSTEMTSTEEVTTKTESTEITSSENVSTETSSITESSTESSKIDETSETQSVITEDDMNVISGVWVIVIIVFIGLAIAAIIGLIALIRKRR